MSKKNRFLIMIFFLSLFSCKSTQSLETVEKLDIGRYLGKWYEIARFPNRFEKGLKCVTANYSLKENGKIEVLNSGFSEEQEKIKDATGTAWVPDPKEEGRLKVRFFWPFAGDYYVIALDEDYNYALVGDPARKYLWILSRTPQLDDAVYARLVQIAKDKGFDTSRLIKTPQDCP